ncbi:hypothetical protein H4R33_000608 [Dimargaris cristalligena]|uniref:ATP synthase complex subunit H-domain-containing protein n=1 Tax=Dimargaris cristalligena TaxID=215637 RepID=A0A4V1J4L2_9FUNG|nr:hypothetical protein H4R33_000608 [Dimargaris cristalligena]RKP35949.1 hypothetical protein BJ085DRAFT_35647 [Dimargaris cristalligena]|eukprot:RKP35949.1 hypothetical protein BJ085DRAFT_35647 [Dimargaris cristalligena]
MYAKMTVAPRLASKLAISASLSTRNFARASAPVFKDVAQEIYMKNLRNFKPSTQKVETDQVKDFVPPKAPQAPKFDQDVSAELAAYDAEDSAIAKSA